MLDAFNKDSSAWRNMFLLKAVLSVICLLMAFVGASMYGDAATSNNTEREKIKAETEWMKSFDMKEALRIEKSIGKPLAEKDVNKLINAKTDFCREHNVAVGSVSTNDFKSAQKVGKTSYKSVTSNFVLNGKWEDVAAVLNEFDKDQHQAISTLSITGKKSDAPMVEKLGRVTPFTEVEARVALVTYFK